MNEHKIGKDLSKGGRGVAKRGWRSARRDSWHTNPNYQHDISGGMARNYPYRVQVMANGAWQFFCMAPHEWFEKDVPRPRWCEPPGHWAERVGQALPLPKE